MMNAFSMFLDTISTRQELIFESAIEHLYISFLAIFIAVAISLPLGIYISRKKKVAEFYIGITAVLQTIPSLALFGFLVPLLGIGTPTALVALIVYALLPILRNTYTGITGVDEGIVEAGEGMGMTPRQILWKIQLPLSLPFMMAGIRTATVLTVGVATLATFVGAGGLGDVIWRGLQSWDNSLVLAGAIPVALLALTFDYILKLVEKKVTPKGIKSK
ncbi:osmoprotectant transport system permease protein [Metabacillus crassostreae]|uniref:ABC transporter permease n=1 Tax=Metabacillus crassostreae TaxID=929098 RepID=UPI001EF89857|nr:ABC transporter permease [Metabacillus crassostreae]MBM7604914.1 osmoprotectant transport system permease protein [Metabacillus crassostreae]